MSRPGKRSPDTNIPSEDNNNNACEIPAPSLSSSGNNYVSTGGARTLSNSPTAILRSRVPESLDVFGFSITPGQFLLVQLAATVMLGFNGSILFLIVLIGYTIFNRVTSSASGRGGNSSAGGGRGGRGLGGGGPSGANIRGMKDLPKPPPRGG